MATNDPVLEYGYCSFCNRADVPICPACKSLCPHGMVPGTWLPCHCGGMGEDDINHLLTNVFNEYNYNHKKGGENDES